MTPRRIFCGIAVLCLSLLTTTIETPAKDSLGFRRSQQRTTRRNNVMDFEQPRPASNQLNVRIHAGTLSKRDIQKVIKAAIKRCGCASPAATLDSWGECFRGCLEGNGVSTASAAACAAACAANPVGCAICAGIHQWIVMGCAQYCVWRNVVGLEESSMSNTPARPTKNGPRTHPVKLSRAASSS